MGCRAHPEREETRICTSCDAHWCAECPRRIVNREVCPSCGHEVRRFAVKKSIGHATVDALGRVMSVEGLTTAAAFAIVHVIGEVTHVWVFGVIYLSALVGYYFAIIRHVGDSREGLPGPDDDLSSATGYALRGIVCSAIGFLPLILWLAYGGGSIRDLHIVLALVLAGQLYMPAAVLAVAITNTTWGAVYPVVWVKVIVRAPGPYVRFAVVWIGSLMVGVGVVIATALLLPPTFIGDFARGFVWCGFWFAQAVLVGNFIRENSAAFGWDTIHAAPEPVPSTTPVALPAAVALRADRQTTPPERASGKTAPPPGIAVSRTLTPPPHLRGKLRFATVTAEITRGGVDARREDGSNVLVMWRDVVGVVVRRLPAAYDSATFVDLVSAAGSTLRFLPWTRLTGDPIDGDGEARMRPLVELVLARCPDAHVDRATRTYLDSRGQPAQLPDVETLSAHDARLA